ncbi:RelA/SpoT domain-containing protein, partial [Sutterella wadsworthensis]
MIKTTPITPSKKSVRKAGEALRNSDLSEAETAEALEILSSWRALYYRPINTFQALIRKKISSLGIKSAIVAQRLKRTPSIVAKLKRFPGMQLDRMQDIGGIRAVVNNVREVRFIHESLIKGRHKHRPVMPPKDYITEPKPDGYRGIHQVFKY